MEPGAYCRHVEAYLCARNEGHLIRIVGPAFELVSGWSAGGVPLSVVRRAVDRACARRQARQSRRRPIRIEFCEADVLDLFDDWKRAVGVGFTAPVSAADPEAGGEGGGRPTRRRSSLGAHLDRVVARLSAWTGNEHPALGGRVTEIAAELDAARASAAPRGKARQRLVDRLAELDGALLAAARDAAGESLRRRLRDDTERELAPFRERMEREAFGRALDAAYDRLLLERVGLPRLTFD
ncbi:MAG: hypothetical protein OXF93_11955 [Acidobacteria bacterium]|nr:hypothetical protein [Acidobacteriota bacterium]